jgi:uncharacterized protein YfdQ (DUF2303 family)
MTTTPQTATAADLKLVADLARAEGLQQANLRQGEYQDAAPFLVLRDADGKEVIQYITGRTDAPARRTGAVTLLDSASFIAYVKLHHNGTPIYGTPNPAAFVAVLNDHVGTKEVGGIPGYRDHRATLKLGYSDELAAWLARNGQGKAFESTEDFASFLETNSFDIQDPPATSFLELALNFQVNESVHFNKQQRLEDGHVQLTFNRIVEGTASSAQGGVIKVPTKFTIHVPVFRGADQPGYDIEAHFRYRLSGNGRIKIWYDLIRPSKVIEDAFRDIWESISTELGVTVLYGTPE